jgi:hypothetical protein
VLAGASAHAIGGEKLDPSQVYKMGSLPLFVKAVLLSVKLLGTIAAVVAASVFFEHDITICINPNKQTALNFFNRIFNNFGY